MLVRFADLISSGKAQMSENRAKALLDFKNSFLAQPELIHLNNAGLTPLPTPVADCLIHWIGRFQQEAIFCDRYFLAGFDQTRERLSRVLNCKIHEVGFFQNTASALSQVALGLKFNAGDEIVIWDQEYPSNFYPWSEAAARSGACLKIASSSADLQTPVENIIQQITKRTKVIAVSWVQYQTGAVTDLQTLVEEAHRNGIWVVVDVIQGLGVRPFDFAALGVDAVCGGSHKWLCGPLSTGFLAIREDRMQDLSPIAVGALSYGTPNDRPSSGAVLRGDAARFEPGSKPALDLLGLGAALELFLETGVEVIGAEAERLSGRLRVGLQDMKYQIHSHSSGPILTFSRGTDLAKVEEGLRDAKTSFVKRGPGIRLSPHAFNTDAQIDRVLNALNF
jgi:cysteine desulfurase/selenocysteine lyase